MRNIRHHIQSQSNLLFLTLVAQFFLFYPPVSYRFRFDDASDQMTTNAIEQQLSLFQRKLLSEGSNLEDSLRHCIHLLLGKLGVRKVSQSLFCRLVLLCRAAYNADIILDKQAISSVVHQLLDLV